MDHAMQHSAEMRECIENCSACHQVCLETAMHCLSMAGAHAELGHVRLLLDCAQLCAVSADFMLRNSDLHPLTCRACAEACERCAASCAEIGPDDAQMQHCAELCLRCAASCRLMTT